MRFGFACYRDPGFPLPRAVQGVMLTNIGEITQAGPAGRLIPRYVATRTAPGYMRCLGPAAPRN